MKTNLENYEERFVDYMEGQLDATEMREVEAFVAQHPELEEDFKLFCRAKLEPDTSVVFSKKESLMRTGTTIRPLFVRIVAAAACVALLIGIGVHFLKPHQELPQQPLIADLVPVKAQAIDTPNEAQTLRKSDVKAVPIPEPAPKHTDLPTLESPELVAALDPIVAQQLSREDSPMNEDFDGQMWMELGERLAALEPYGDNNLTLEDRIANQKEQAIASLQDVLFGNLRQNAKTFYKRTAKTVMDVYYTADARIDEAKEQLMASR